MPLKDYVELGVTFVVGLFFGAIWHDEWCTNQFLKKIWKDLEDIKKRSEDDKRD